MNINEVIYRVIDTETTGVEPEKDKVIEVAYADVFAGLVVNHDDYLINHGVHIPPTAKAVHHITEKMCAATGIKPSENEDRALLNVSNAMVFVAHHAPFDRAFLPFAWDEQWICTMRLAKQLYPAAASYGLQALRYELELEPELPEGLAPHRALYDVYCTVALLDRALQDLPKDVATIEQLIEWHNRPVLLQTMPLGKHRGEPFDQVPRSYLHWMAKTMNQPDCDWDIDLRSTIRHYLAA